ncbi:hypothetical protein ABMA27_008576, partial [Loxostege sticticalis]
VKRDPIHETSLSVRLSVRLSPGSNFSTTAPNRSLRTGSGFLSVIREISMTDKILTD